MVNSASFKNLRLSLAVDIQVLIANENLAADLAFDDVNITYFYPNKPDNIIGTGVIPGAILSKGGQVERTLRSEFDAPIATFGACSSSSCPSSTWMDGPTYMPVTAAAAALAPLTYPSIQLLSGR